MKKMFNEGNKKQNFISSSGSGTVINYGYGSGSTIQKVIVPTVPVPVPQHCVYWRPGESHDSGNLFNNAI